MAGVSRPRLNRVVIPERGWEGGDPLVTQITNNDDDEI